MNEPKEYDDPILRLAAQGMVGGLGAARPVQGAPTPCGRGEAIPEDQLDEWLEQSEARDLDMLRAFVDSDSCYARDATYSRRILGLLKRVEELERRLGESGQDPDPDRQRADAGDRQS